MFSKEEWKNIMNQERFKKLVNRLSSETLHVILDDPAKARKYALKNIDPSIPDNQKEEYVSKMVRAMQEFAKIVLEKRNNNNPK